MRHRVYGKHLGRNKDERSRLFKTLLIALFTHGSIETSQDKAKAIKGLIDKVINLAKNKNSQRLLQSYLTNKQLRERLIKDVTPKLGNRISGYTSMVRLGTRAGDQTMMVKISLIGAENLESSSKSQESRKKTEKVVKTETKANEKIVRKPTRVVKVSASKKGAKKS